MNVYSAFIIYYIYKTIVLKFLFSQDFYILKNYQEHQSTVYNVGDIYQYIPRKTWKPTI